MELSEIVTTDPSLSEAAASNTPSLGQEDFLKMLIAQLENQDPLNPQDSTEFTAQLAQFSSLEQLISMRTSIDELTGAQSESRSLSTASLIGKTALVGTPSFTLSGVDGEPLPELYLDLPEAGEIQGIGIYAGDEKVAGFAVEGTLPAGLTRLDWSDADVVPNAGRYELRVTPVAGGVEPGVQVRSRITGASLGNGEPTLLFGEVEVPLAALREIRE